jgi:nucleoside-diphosphate-sugar epimerase
MYRKIFLAGATGAIGSRLMPLLLDAGYEVFGTTRSKTKAAALQALGVTSVVVDVFDAPALSRAIAAIRPEIVIHQLTDLPANLEPSGIAEGITRTTRIRTEGTRNLVTAALESGTRRLIAQSLACWVYAPGRQPYFENDPLDLSAEGTGAIVVEGIVNLERLTLTSSPLEGIVLRYGQIYGPGTGSDDRPDPLLCMSTRRPTRPCSPSKEPNRGFSISPRTPAMSQSQKHAASLAGTQAFA